LVSLVSCLFGLSTMWVVKLIKLLIVLPSLVLPCLLMFSPTFVSVADASFIAFSKGF
jgi:hypothetical protein